MVPPSNVDRIGCVLDHSLTPNYSLWVQSTQWNGWELASVFQSSRHWLPACYSCSAASKDTPNCCDTDAGDPHIDSMVRREHPSAYSFLAVCTFSPAERFSSRPCAS